MEQMASSVRLNADNSEKANNLMRDSMEQAKASGTVVAQAVESMAEIAQSSRKIADIISLIDGIAFQTNLLALNASVEAARAGEHGRGFAVVAGEVRSLAQRAADAAKDITGLINDSGARVEQGSHLVNETGEALDKIRQSLDMVAFTVSEIASASNEQASGIEQVNHAVAQLDVLNQQNSALVEESAAAAGALTDQAAELNELMQFFKLEEQHPSPALAQAQAKPMPEHQDIKHLVSDLR
jgi:methyl-accepting chemotaxis protein